MRLVLTSLLAASLLILASGCDQLARSTRVLLRPGDSGTAMPASAGGPSVSSAGWVHPVPGGFGVWTHEAAPDPQHCNEWNVEPAAETDDAGHLCETFVP